MFDSRAEALAAEGLAASFMGRLPAAGRQRLLHDAMRLDVPAGAVLYRKGDGSLVLLPTPGHTPGSTSLLVRREGAAPLLMVGDLTYEAELLAYGRIPGVGNAGQLRASSALVRQLQAQFPDLAILAAHDPGAAARLAAAIAGRSI